MSREGGEGPPGLLTAEVVAPGYFFWGVAPVNP
jgi:hypothetical protein